MTARPSPGRGGTAALALLVLLAGACAPRPGRVEGRAVEGGRVARIGDIELLRAGG